MHDLMAHFITPAAERIWESAGSVITEEGEISLEPKDDEGWSEVIFGAQVPRCHLGKLTPVPHRYACTGARVPPMSPRGIDTDLPIPGLGRCSGAPL